MQQTSSFPKIRYAFLDELRGFMVLCMVFYHGFLTVYSFLELEFSWQLFEFFSPAEPLFAGGFIFLSGLMCGFSHSNIRRGLLACGLAAGVTVVTVLADRLLGTEIAIYFGVLHLLGFSMLFCGLFDFVLKRIPKWLGLFLNLALFVALFGVADNNYNLFGIQAHIPQSWHETPGMFLLGITSENFYSADFFPLIPWLFLFVAGYYAVKTGFIQRFQKLFLPVRCKPLGFLGRHALIIYILHQPVIVAICAILTAFL